MQPSLPQRIMKITRPVGLEKTNPIKPNFPAPLIRVLYTLRGPAPCSLSSALCPLFSVLCPLSSVLCPLFSSLTS